MRIKTTIYVCRLTGQRFLDRHRFAEHLVALRKDRIAERWHEKHVQILRDFQSKARTFKEISDWVSQQDWLGKLANSTGRIVGLQFSESMATFNPFFPHTHSHPREQQPYDWYDKSNNARGFPGIRVPVFIKYNEDFHGILRALNIYGGTGNGNGVGQFRYHDATIWCSDWPSLKVDGLARDFLSP